MYKIEDRHGWNDDPGYLRTRLYQSEKTFEQAWKQLTRHFEFPLGEGMWMRVIAYEINTSGQWEFVKEAKRA